MSRSCSMFDEPTSGLDPSQVIAVRDLIRELAGRQTVLIASHVLTEIEQIANRVMILLDGRLLTTDALRHGGQRQRLRLQVDGTEPSGARLHRRGDRACARLRSRPGIGPGRQDIWWMPIRVRSWPRNSPRRWSGTASRCASSPRCRLISNGYFWT